ncbi:hypothetical protein X726_25755 [Mesorhizobium sp. L103C105A0]|nr:hypothetical protein X726_25755 [Mesorhizobium sp. L103C105A0]
MKGALRMATNLEDGKTAQSSDELHGGNRGGDKDQRKTDKTANKSSQAAGSASR